MRDEILEELWKVKDGIAKESDYDMHRLFETLRATQAKSQHPLAKRPLSTTGKQASTQS